MAGWFEEYGFSAEEKRLGAADKIDGAVEYSGLNEHDWLDAVNALKPDTPVALEAVDINLLIAAYQDGKIDALKFMELQPLSSSARMARRALRQAGVAGIENYSANLDSPWMVGYCGRREGDPYP